MLQECFNLSQLPSPDEGIVVLVLGIVLVCRTWYSSSLHHIKQSLITNLTDEQKAQPKIYCLVNLCTKDIKIKLKNEQTEVIHRVACLSYLRICAIRFNVFVFSGIGNKKHLEIIISC